MPSQFKIRRQESEERAASDPLLTDPYRLIERLLDRDHRVHAQAVVGGQVADERVVPGVSVTLRLVPVPGAMFSTSSTTVIPTLSVSATLFDIGRCGGVDACGEREHLELVKGGAGIRDRQFVRTSWK